MADKTLSTVLYIEAGLGDLADSLVERPLPVAFVVASNFMTNTTLIVKDYITTIK